MTIFYKNLGFGKLPDQEIFGGEEGTFQRRIGKRLENLSRSALMVAQQMGFLFGCNALFPVSGNLYAVVLA
ncbi:MAG: hypothetical protein CL609_04635 [Anaerolineaceae bacterium]|nr:hypothetical protein [Anaerolineaceae bacterium]